jgi:ferredoxin-type protein NapG
MTNDAKSGGLGGLTRRNFTFAAVGIVALLGLGGGAKLVQAQPVCRPPGGQDELAFISACLRCEKCREVCPMNVLVPAPVDKGLINGRTPTLNFKAGWCDYCNQYNGGSPKCVEVCPTQALSLGADAEAKNTIIGKAYIVKDWCLGWQGKGCQICYRECSYEAIVLDEFARVGVLYDACNGCGRCENVCVSQMSGSYTSGATDRAITVKPIEAVDSLLKSEVR